MPGSYQCQWRICRVYLSKPLTDHASRARARRNLRSHGKADCLA